MEDNRDSIGQIEDVAPGETPESPGQETVYGAEVLDFMNKRGDELGGDEEPVGVVSELETTEPEPEADPEPEVMSRAARRAFAREKRLRAEREELQAKRDEWKSETAEVTSKLEAFEQSKAAAITDPLSHLKEIGLSDDDVMDLAREIYYRNMPEQATPAVRAEMAAIDRDRRLRKLEAKNKAKAEPAEPDEQEKAPQGPTQEYQEYEQNYRKSLTNFAATIDPGQFPLASEYAKQDFSDLVQGMFNAAVQNARNTNGQGGDLTPEECMASIENHLRARQQATPRETQIEEPEPARRKATLRNKNTAIQPNEKLESDMTYEELREESRKRFQSTMREKGLIL